MSPPKPKAVAPSSRQVISRQLRALILARGLSIYSLGREAGVDPGVIQRFVNEERDIRLDTADRLADVLGLRLIEGAKSRGRPSAKPPRGRRPVRPEPITEAGDVEDLDDS